MKTFKYIEEHVITGLANTSSSAASISRFADKLPLVLIAAIEQKKDYFFVQYEEELKKYYIIRTPHYSVTEAIDQSKDPELKDNVTISQVILNKYMAQSEPEEIKQLRELYKQVTDDSFFAKDIKTQSQLYDQLTKLLSESLEKALPNILQNNKKLLTDCHQFLVNHLMTPEAGIAAEQHKKISQQLYGRRKFDVWKHRINQSTDLIQQKLPETKRRPSR